MEECKFGIKSVQESLAPLRENFAKQANMTYPKLLDKVATQEIEFLHLSQPTMMMI
jgi:hypothetical protein